MQSNIVFIGAGKIAEAWIERLVHSNSISPESITACDPADARLRELASTYPGIQTSTDNTAVVRSADFVVIATPPSVVAAVLAEVRPFLRDSAVVISLAAGVPLAMLASTANGTTVLRVMPNTPGMVGEGMNLVCFSPKTAPERRRAINDWLGAFGQLLEIQEAEMEAYGALCSVGPTFLFPIMESLIDAAVEAGLAPELARQATAQLFVGSGRLLAETKRSLPELNGMIGLHTLAESAAKQLLADAYKEALGKLKGLAARMDAGA